MLQGLMYSGQLCIRNFWQNHLSDEQRYALRNLSANSGGKFNLPDMDNWDPNRQLDICIETVEREIAEGIRPARSMRCIEMTMQRWAIMFPGLELSPPMFPGLEVSLPNFLQTSPTQETDATVTETTAVSAQTAQAAPTTQAAKNQPVSAVNHPNQPILSGLSPRFQAPPVTATVVGAAAEPFDIRNYFPPLSADELEIRLREARSLSFANFSEMTNIEIYDFIENWFIDNFGENFMKAHNLGTAWINSHYSECGTIFFSKAELNDIGLAFNSVLSNVFGGAENAREVNRERLFGDMGKDEIRDTIRARYPQTLTKRELFLMFSEMEAAGVFNGEPRTGTTVGCVLYSYRSFSTLMSQSSWESILNEPVNVPLLLGGYNDKLYIDRRPPSAQATSFLKEIFGGVKGSNGWFIGAINVRTINVSEEEDISLQKKILEQRLKQGVPDLLEYFLNSLEKRDLSSAETEQDPEYLYTLHEYDANKLQGAASL